MPNPVQNGPDRSKLPPGGQADDPLLTHELRTGDRPRSRSVAGVKLPPLTDDQIALMVTEAREHFEQDRATPVKEFAPSVSDSAVLPTRPTVIERRFGASGLLGDSSIEK